MNLWFWATLPWPSKVGRKQQRLPLSSQEMPSGVLAMEPGRAGSGGPTNWGGKEQQTGAHTGSLGPRAALRPPAPPAAEGTHGFLPAAPGPARPLPAQALGAERSPGSELWQGGRVLSRGNFSAQVHLRGLKG